MKIKKLVTYILSNTECDLDFYDSSIQPPYLLAKL